MVIGDFSRSGSARRVRTRHQRCWASLVSTVRAARLGMDTPAGTTHSSMVTTYSIRSLATRERLT